MFNFDRFNLSRFSLGDGGSTCPISHTFSESLNAVAGAAIPVETTGFFNDVLRGSMRGAIAIRSAFESAGYLQASCQMRANILVAMGFPAHMAAKITGSQNSCIVINLSDQLEGEIWGSKDITQTRLLSKDSLTSKVNGVKDIKTSPFVYEVLTAIAGAIKQSTETAVFTVTIPAGAELRIDSDTFRVTVNGENMLHEQAGDWVNLARELLYIDIESATGGDLQGTMIYTERYL